MAPPDAGLLLANIVLQADGRVRFIDLEYGAANFAAFDIANHFVEFVGCSGRLDYRRWLPGRAWRLGWCREYLAAREGRRVAEGEVEALQARVEAFVPAAHLLWAAWAAVQAANSSIAFDFPDYSLQRLQEYRRWRGAAGLPARLGRREVGGSWGDEINYQKVGRLLPFVHTM